MAAKDFCRDVAKDVIVGAAVAGFSAIVAKAADCYVAGAPKREAKRKAKAEKKAMKEKQLLEGYLVEDIQKKKKKLAKQTRD